jgi:hypothetical protein
MPKAKIRARGGAVRVRTKKLPDGRYIHVFVVRKAGPRGGHTVAGEPTKPQADARPSYRMKPDLPKRKGKSHGKQG